MPIVTGATAVPDNPTRCRSCGQAIPIERISEDALLNSIAEHAQRGRVPLADLAAVLNALSADTWYDRKRVGKWLRSLGLKVMCTRPTGDKTSSAVTCLMGWKLKNVIPISKLVAARSVQSIGVESIAP